MSTNNRFGRTIHFIRALFPLQLIFGHLKYNFLAVCYWLVLFLIVSDAFGSKFGLPYLFYSPEYQGEISWLSFFLMGFSIGGFIMAFNMYSYMKLSTKYKFLATLSRPFVKFCWNNSVIPIAFSIFYIYHFTQFQYVEEFATNYQVLGYVFAYIFGVLLFVFISIFYFFRRNKDLFKISGNLNPDQLVDEPIGSLFHKKISWTDLFRYESDRSYIYMSGVGSWKKSRSVKHYDKSILEKVFYNNRINASVFEFVTILTFIILGLFRELPIFELPAGMSIVLLLSIILMLFSIFSSWLKYWTYPAIFATIMGMNFLSENSSYFQYESYAYGLDYQSKKLEKFNIDNIHRKADDPRLIDQSKTNMLAILNTWKKKTGKKCPKLVIVMTSGGGSRSALWTFSVLQRADSRLKGKLNDHIQLITGASGGMIGASYYRSLLLEQKLGNPIDLSNPKYNRNISKDLLNKLSFSAYSNDLFVRFQTLKIGKNYYTKDRGYAFEQHLHQNTENVMNKPLNYFTKYEREAVIPTMIFSPTIVNDGRRLLIASQSLAFLSHASGPSKLTDSYENIDFQSFFANSNVDSLRFSSVMRMSATFPFVLPMISMPTIPKMQLMDAGLRDNYGGKVTMEYLYELQDWIKKNTSGVVILQIRDTKKLLNGDELNQVSLFDKFTLPFGNMLNNFTRTQDFDLDELMKIGFESFAFPVDIVSFNLREAKMDRISLSWHLTSHEKLKIANALRSPGNQASMRELELLFGIK